MFPVSCRKTTSSFAACAVVNCWAPRPTGIARRSIRAAPTASKNNPRIALEHHYDPWEVNEKLRHAERILQLGRRPGPGLEETLRFDPGFRATSGYNTPIQTPGQRRSIASAMIWLLIAAGTSGLSLRRPAHCLELLGGAQRSLESRPADHGRGANGFAARSAGAFRSRGHERSGEIGTAAATCDIRAARGRSAISPGRLGTRWRASRSRPQRAAP